MQDNTITEEERKELIESLRNNYCLILNAPLTHLEDGAIESFKSIASTLENHCVNNFPVQYEFTPNENMLSWLSYYDKSQIIGIEVSPEHSLPILYILDIYNGWHKHHKSIVQSQFLEYASQCTAISINGSIFNPINCTDAFCDWYIRSNIGSLNLGLALDINEDNIYCLTIKINYNFIQRVHTPQVLENHFGEFFNKKAQNYLFPITTPPAPNEIAVGHNTFDFEKEIEALTKSENKFHKGLRMGFVINHFKVFYDNNYKTEYLSKESFVSFIKRGFLNDDTEPIQKINYSYTEKGFVIKRFYEFFVNARHEFYYPNNKKGIVDLIIRCFENLGTESEIKSFLNPNKTKQSW